MVAMARVLHHDLGPDIKVVFMGPCVAKKRASIDTTHVEVDAVLTFAELRDMFRRRGIKPENFDGRRPASTRPTAALGAVFPIAGGLLQTAGLTEDLLTGELVVAEGRGEFIEAITEFDLARADTRLLDVLSCAGCFAGPGMTSDETMLQRRSRDQHLRPQQRLAGLTDEEEAEVASAVETVHRTSTSPASIVADAQTMGDSATPEELDDILHRMGKFRAEDLLNCGACGYDTCVDHAHAVYAGLADSDMCLPHTIEQLQAAYQELEESHKSLEEAKEALERSGKLASMGQLAAGIAHEVNNPLGTLLLHANLLLEECEDDTEIKTDLETIVDQANRCKRIISGLLNFARQNRVVRQPTDVSELVDKVIRTAPTADNVTVDVQDRLADPIAEIDADQIVQVLTNLFDQRPACDARRRQHHDRPHRRSRHRDHPRVRHGHRDPQGVHGPPVRPLLHHEAGGHGYRPGPGRHPRHRQDAPRPDQRRVERRPGGRSDRHHLHHRTAAARSGHAGNAGHRGCDRHLRVTPAAA